MIVTIVTTLTPLLALAADDWKPAAGPLMTRWAKDVTPDKVLPEYPRPQMVRKEWTNLNGLWDYAITPKADAQPTSYAGKVLVPFPAESALSGVMKTVGADNRLWYRRTFDPPEAPAGGRVLLHFGAVDWETTVWLNGKELGVHRGGYDPFSFDVTDAIKKDGPNELVVSVWDPTNDGPQPRGKQVKNPRGIYYTPVTGIWQTVWLETVPKSYVRGLKITPDVDGQQVKVEVDVAGDDAAQVSVAILDGERELASLNGGRSATIKVPNPKLWTPESPNLYGLRVKVGDDAVDSYFGMRKIDVKKDDKGVNRIYLNNQPIFMAGPLDQGFWPDGIYTAPTDDALKYDIEITKQLGFNATRKHVKVEPARWYYWCDRLGLIVWQDMPSGDRSVRSGAGQMERTPESAKIFETELKAMIDTHYNHPSIVMWVVFNEGWGQFDTVNRVNWTKQYDPSRLADPASGWNDYPAGDVIDMHHYPGAAAPAPQPTRASVLGEFGGLGLATPGHMWKQENWGYRGVPDGKALTRQYVKLMSRAWQLRETEGLNAAIYTQITDVETEANGLLTYDRAVIKVDVDPVAQANRGHAPPPAEQRVVLPTSEKAAQDWRYTTDKPADDWNKPDFNDSSWKQGPGGFGTEGTPGSVVRTTWNTPDIWIRREFTLESVPANPLLLMHHDEDAEVYVNGVLAARERRHVNAYEEFDLAPDAKAALKAGKNVIAVHCHQTTGGQYIDVGIVDLK
jgi:hypothetical protein